MTAPTLLAPHHTDTDAAAALGLVVAALEALIGRRPLHQVRPRLEREAFLSLTHCAHSGEFSNARIGRIRVQMPTPHSVEAATRLGHGDRWLACTVRLDYTRRWMCTELHVLGVTAL